MSQAATPVEARKEDKGNAFTGVWAGTGYIFLTKLFGFTKAFYNRAVGNIAVPEDAVVLDMGCGPGVLSFALAERMPAGCEIHGIDLSEDQIRYAREKAVGMTAIMDFVVGSMDELPFPDASFDLVVTSMALHEAARVLKPGGRFLLVDWSKPRFGFTALI